MINKIVVTGASGYIASSIIEKLLIDPTIDKVVAIVRDKNNLNKYKFLRDLDGAKEKLVLESGDLESANYDEIFKDSTSILHVASPYIYQSENPEKEIVQPAIQGNLRVLNAASKHPSIKKVIITSSVVAITDFQKKKEIYNEDDWNDSSSINTPYPYSKYLAEKAVWNYKSENPSIQYDIIIINPAFVLGPGVKGFPSLNTSLLTFRNSLLGEGDSQVINRLIGLIDIRDVVKAHINALSFQPPTSLYPTRYLMSNNVLTTFQMNDIVKELFPQYDIIGSKQDASIKPHQYQFISKSPLFNLNQPYIDTKTTLKDCVNYLIDQNFYNPSLKQ